MDNGKLINHSLKQIALRKHLQRNGRNFFEISGTPALPFEKSNMFSDSAIMFSFVLYYVFFCFIKKRYNRRAYRALPLSLTR